jgi:hypothetical protein
VASHSRIQYPPDRAWQITHAVLEETKGVAAEEHQPDGYVIALHPAVSVGPPTRIGSQLAEMNYGAHLVYKMLFTRYQR